MMQPRLASAGSPLETNKRPTAEDAKEEAKRKNSIPCSNASSKVAHNKSEEPVSKEEDHSIVEVCKNQGYIV